MFAWFGDFLTVSLSVFFSLLFLSGPLLAQSAPPTTDIYLVDIEESGADLDGLKVVGEPINITRRAAYDNQPSFLPDGNLIYTAQTPDGDVSQTDIQLYDVETRQLTRLTDTAESEYSPTPMPGGKRFSVIRVEADGTQRLWAFPLDAASGDSPELLLPKVKPVGYHVWIDARELILFVLGDPATLERATLQSPKPERITDSIGRSLHKIPGLRTASYVRKESEQRWVIQELNLEDNSSTPILETLPQREDHVWTSSGILLMADGSKLYRARLHGVRSWAEVADFSANGIQNITRLAVSPGVSRIAFVADASGETNP